MKYELKMLNICHTWRVCSCYSCKREMS